MNRDEKRVLTLTVGAHGLVHLYEGLLPPLIPLVMANFGGDYFQMGILVSVFAYAFGLGALPAGILADKLGARRLVILFLFGAGATALAVLPTRSLWTYGVLTGVLGLFCSTYHPAANTLLSLFIREKGTAFAVHGIAGSVGIAAVPLLAAWLGSLFGWRSPYLVFGLLGLGLGVAALRLPRRNDPADGGGKDGHAAEAADRLPYIDLTLFFLTVMLLGLTYRGVMTFLPTYLGQRVHLGLTALGPVAVGGTFSSLALLAGAAGQYAAGRLTDRLAPEAIYLAAVTVGTGFTFLMAVSSDWLLVVAAILFAFFFFAIQPVQNYLISSYVPAHRRGLGYGIMFLLSFGVGSTAAAVAGYLADRFGLTTVFTVMGLCFAAATVAVLVLFWRRPAHRTV